MASYDMDTAGVLWVMDSEESRPYSYPKAVERFGADAVNPFTRFAMYCIRASGKYLAMEQWKDERGISAGTIRRRLQNGWDMLDAVNTPGTGWRASPSSSKASTLGRPAQLWECGTKSYTIAQWSQE